MRYVNWFSQSKITAVKSFKLFFFLISKQADLFKLVVLVQSLEKEKIKKNNWLSVNFSFLRTVTQKMTRILNSNKKTLNFIKYNYEDLSAKESEQSPMLRLSPNTENHEKSCMEDHKNIKFIQLH